MRFVKVFGLILLFFVSIMFFMQNTEVLTQRIPLQLDFLVGGLQFLVAPLPVYFLILVSFLVGALLTLAFFIVDRYRFTKAMKQKNVRLASLEQEVASLRNLPLENKIATNPTNMTNGDATLDDRA